jgi:hypothetical protein
MSSFLVNKNLSLYYSPVVNFDTGFLFFGDFLIVRNYIINKIIFTVPPQKGHRKEDGKMGLYIDQSISRKITHSKINREEG